MTIIKFFSTLLALLFLGAVLAQLDAAKVEEMDAYLEAQEATGRFMGTVLVAQGDEVLFERGYGFANVELGVPNTPTTRHRIGSVTKQFTAALIYQLQEEGKLSVEDTLDLYLPDFPRAGDITLQQLLDHTSGVWSYTNEGLVELARQTLTTDELIATFSDRPLDFEPGERFSYSNSGYVLLTAVVERASGMAYTDYLRDFLEPLGLSGLAPDDLQAVIPQRASGYSMMGGKLVNANFIDPSIPTGAGNLLATVHELHQWDLAVMRGAILTDASREAMFSGTVQVDPNTVYSSGWMLGERFGQRVIEHGGGIFGFSAMNSFYPEEELVVVVLANVDIAPSGQIAQALAAIALGEAYELPVVRTAVPVDEDILERYVGAYELMPGFIITITVEDGQLYAQPTGQPAIELLAESETDFFQPMVDAQISFIVEDEVVTGFTFTQAGQSMPAQRLDEAPEEPQELTLEPEQLERYVGVYELMPGFTITITTEEGRLYGQATGQPPFELFAESETEFFLRVAPARIVFELDDTGEAASLTLYQGGQALQGRRSN